MAFEIGYNNCVPKALLSQMEDTEEETGKQSLQQLA